MNQCENHPFKVTFTAESCPLCAWSAQVRSEVDVPLAMAVGQLMSERFPHGRERFKPIYRHSGVSLEEMFKFVTGPVRYRGVR